jgi:hypothetical protein
MNIKNISFLLGFLLLVALLPLPYGFYTFLRLSVFVGAILLAHTFYERDKPNWVLILAGLAILFNPVIPIYLSREAWIPIDVVSAILFFYVGNVLSKYIK